MSRRDPRAAARYIDDHGCMTIVSQRYTDPKRSNVLRLRLQVRSQDKEALERLRTAMGIEAPIHHVAAGGITTLSLDYDGPRARDAVAYVRPYLRDAERIRQADVALRFYGEGQAGKNFGKAGVPWSVLAVREECFAAMRRDQAA